MWPMHLKQDLTLLGFEKLVPFLVDDKIPHKELFSAGVVCDVGHTLR